MARSTDTALPGWTRAMAELPAMAGLLYAQFAVPPGTDQTGQGKPVLVIPGFGASDFTTGLLRRTLQRAGFQPHGWNLGHNLGMRREKFDAIIERVEQLFAESGTPVALIGWSLGGLYAREIAKFIPDKVSIVITLGTPFSVDMHHNNVWMIYEAVNGHEVDHPPIPFAPKIKPPVKTIAFWSGRDGFVAPASASGTAQETDQSVELSCTHHEFLYAPQSLKAIVRALS